MSGPYTGGGGSGLDLPLTAFGELAVAEATPQVAITLPYNLNTALVNTDTDGANGSVAWAAGKGIADSSANASSWAEFTTKRFFKYQNGQGGLLRFTAEFDTPAVGNEQTAGFIDDDNGLAFGYSGTRFGILRRSGTTDSWIYQSDWNQSAVSWLNPQVGNVYQIRYQWLGHGAIVYFLEAANERINNGQFIPVHTIYYANTSTAASMAVPSFPFRVRSENTTNTTSIQVKAGSAFAAVEGRRAYLGPRFSISATLGSISTTETAVLTIRNKATFASANSKILVFPDYMDLTVDSNTAPVQLRAIANTTLGGSPSYTDVATNQSAVEYDVAGTTVTGGVPSYPISAGRNLSKTIQVPTGVVSLVPGETLTIAAVKTGGADFTATVGLSWVEDH